MFGAEIVAVQEVIQKKDAIQEFADLAKKKDIEEFLRVSLKSETLGQMLPILAKQAIAMKDKEADSTEIAALLNERVADPSYIDQFVPTFEELFSHEEIKTLLHFQKLFATPAKQPFCFPLYYLCGTALEEILSSYPTITAQAQVSSVIEVTKDSFQKEVLESALPVIVDVYGDFCPPCKQIAPIFAELSNEMKGKVKFVKLSATHEPELAEEFNIRGVPTFLFIKEGKIVDRQTGFREKQVLALEILKAFL